MVRSLESDGGGRYQDMDDAAQHARAREMPTMHRGIMASMSNGQAMRWNIVSQEGGSQDTWREGGSID